MSSLHKESFNTQLINRIGARQGINQAHRMTIKLWKNLKDINAKKIFIFFININLYSWHNMKGNIKLTRGKIRFYSLSYKSYSEKKWIPVLVFCKTVNITALNHRNAMKKPFVI